MKIAIIEPLGITEKEVVTLQERFLAAGDTLVYYNSPAQDEAEKVRRAQEAEIIILANTPLPRTVLEKCPQLKFLSVAFTGVDHVDMEYCHAHDIVVSNCSGYANEAVSELVFGLAISLYRQILLEDAAVRHGKTRAGMPNFELCGKKFGIIGAGAIGRKTAMLAQAFGCEVYAYNRSVKEIPGVTFMPLDELLPIVDILSVHVPLTAETRGLLDEVAIRKMKKTAILINTARGLVVDSAALAAALTDGRLAGAAVDVFETEPPLMQDHLLLQAPNLLATPHIGFATQEAMEKRAVIAFENIRAWQSGKAQNMM